MKRIFFLLIVFILAFSTCLFLPVPINNTIKAGETYQWIPINDGLFGGDVRVLVVDPTNANTIYAATYNNGIYKSTNGGVRWIEVNKGPTGTQINALVVDPKNTSTIYAGTSGSVFKSTDGGANWSDINNGLKTYVTVDVLAIDPLNTNNIFAITYEGVYKTTNGGSSWNSISKGISGARFYYIASYPVSGTTLFIATSIGIYKSTDGGDNWNKINKGLTSAGINYLAIDPVNSSVIYAGISGNVFKSTDGGTSWSEINNGLGSYTTMNSLAIDQTNTSTIYAGNSKGVYKSTNGGLNWSQTALYLSFRYTPSTVYSLAINPNNSQIIYAGTYSSDIFESTDSGTKWSRTNLNIVSGGYFVTVYPIQSLAIDPANTETIYAGTDGRGLYKSVDGGASWNRMENGLTSSDVRSIAIDKISTKTIYAGTAGGVFKSVDGGANWNIMNKGLTSKSVNCFAIDPTNTEVIYTATSGGVFKTSDGGNNWIKLSYGLKSTSVSFIAIDPINTGILYAGTSGSGAYKLASVIVYNIVSSSSSGGSISPLGTITVNAGDSETFTINPDNGFKIKDVKVNGTSVGTVSTYTFENISSDYTIEVVFEPITYSISAFAGTGGSISPSGTITVNSGNSKTFSIYPNSGYSISSVKVDGSSVDAVSSYTFNNIISNHTISATFEKQVTQTTIILQIGNSNFTVNGVSNTLDSPPIIKNSRTLLPIRAVVEALGGTVGWDATERKVTVSLGSTTIELWIGKNIAKVNSVDTPIDATNSKVVPEIINSRTMLPLRFVAENLGATVNWDGTTQTITIIYQAP